MQLNLKLSHKALILIAVPLFFEVIFFAMLGWLVLNAEQEAERELKSKQIISTADQIANLSQEAGVALYQYKRDPDPLDLKKYQNRMEEVNEQVERLLVLSANNPKEFELAQKAKLGAKQGEELGNEVIEAIKNGDQSKDVTMRVFKISRDVASLLHRIGRLERQQGEVVSTRRFRGLVLPLILVGVGVSVLMAVALALFFNAGTTRRLKVLMDNSMRLARGATLSGRLGGGDELAALDEVFHKMAHALEEALRKERAIVENAVDVICSVDEKLFFKAASPACLDVFGYEPDELIGMKLAKLVVPDDLDRTISEFARLRSASDATTPFFENRIQRGERVVDVRWSAHWSDEEKSYFCVVSDISARREVERLKQEFISMMSHDLRTPLMSIQASLSLLSVGAAGDLPESAKRNVLDAERNISYIISLINSLIDVERMDSANLQVHIHPTELAPLLDSAIQAVRSLAANKSIKLECSAPELDLNADADRVTQVLINLLSNALKFSPRDSTIKVTAVAIDDATVEIQVSDEGRGIPAAQLDSVFERFKQVKATDATTHKGSGLGLAICKSIVEAHGGTIGVRSVEGEGTTFWFRLPRAEPLLER